MMRLSRMPGRARRIRLAAPLALLALTALAPAQASAAWTVVFRDDGRPAWQQLFKLVGPACDKVTRSGTALRIKSCALRVAGNRTAMVWSNKLVAANKALKVEFDFTHLAAANDPAGTMSGLMLLATGDGTAGYPADVAAWGAQCCASPAGTTGYGKHVTGLQLNIAYRFDPRGVNDALRLRGLKGTAGDYELLAESGPQFPFQDGRTYHVTATRAGDKLTVAVRDAATGLTSTFSATHPYIGSLTGGRVGFRQMQGRDGRFANLKVSVGS